MKKFIAAAMIALLAVGTVFAAPTLTGSAELTGKLDFTKDQIGAGFDANITDPKATFTFEGATGEKNGEGDFRAEIAGSVSLKAVEANAADAAINVVVDSIAISKADLLFGENWKVSILGPSATTTFAKGWYSANGKNNDLVDEALKAGKAGAGVTVTAYDYQISAAGYVGQTKKEGTLNVLTPSYTLAEGFTLQAAAGAVYAEGKLTAGTGLALAFTSDVVTVNAKADFADEYVQASKDNKLAGDVRVDVIVDPVTVNAYYGSTNNYYEVGAKLSLKELTGLDLTFNAGVIDVKKNAGKVLVGTAYGFENGNVSANATVATTDALDWTLGLKADYTFENVGKLEGGLDFAGAKAEALSSLKANVAFTNTTLIDGATLSVKYETGNVLKDEATRFGAITASCKLAF